MKCLDFCRLPSLSLALLLTLALTVACGNDGGGSSASGGSSSPAAPSPSAPQPAECRSVNCAFSGTVAAYGISDVYLLLPAAVGQLTLTLTWADSNINLDLGFCRVYTGIAIRS